MISQFQVLDYVAIQTNLVYPKKKKITKSFIRFFACHFCICTHSLYCLLNNKVICSSTSWVPHMFSHRLTGKQFSEWLVKRKPGKGYCVFYFCEPFIVLAGIWFTCILQRELCCSIQDTCYLGHRIPSSPNRKCFKKGALLWRKLSTFFVSLFC